ncbi:MAG: hypothetical protein MRECE_15c024 [Mycoplasmataceae bacterium CE_OT135]|nr:MAG: hypothetical protein MRECE_15c024 [Mycoplasmataceae bacterium CE_OT135]
MKKKPIQRPRQASCFKCSHSLTVKFNPGQGKYVEKNHWAYWTGQKSHQGKYICDACLIHLYKKDKWTYLENITNESRRRILRTYIYDNTLGARG